MVCPSVGETQQVLAIITEPLPCPSDRGMAALRKNKSSLGCGLADWRARCLQEFRLSSTVFTSGAGGRSPDACDLGYESSLPALTLRGRALEGAGSRRKVPVVGKSLHVGRAGN